MDCTNLSSDNGAFALTVIPTDAFTTDEFDEHLAQYLWNYDKLRPQTKHAHLSEMGCIPLRKESPYGVCPPTASSRVSGPFSFTLPKVYNLTTKIIISRCLKGSVDIRSITKTCRLMQIHYLLSPLNNH